MFESKLRLTVTILYHHFYKTTSSNLLSTKLSTNVETNVNIETGSVLENETYVLERKYLIMKLQTLLGIKSSLALEIVKQDEKLAKISETVLDRNYKLCKSYEIRSDTLVKYPAILYEKDVGDKLKLLKSLQLNKDLNSVAPLLLMSDASFTNLINKQGERGLESRVRYFCDKFNISPDVMYDVLLKKPFMRHIQIKTVEKNTKLLNDRGITSEDIVRDFWVLRYSSASISNRFDKAEEEHVDKLKTWMVRGKEEIFNAYIKRKSENKLILGNDSLIEYLSRRLNCSAEEVAALIERMPAIRQKSMRKLREIIDFLYGEGFEAQHIRRVPKILLHSVATSRKRLQELARLGGRQLDSVHILTKSHKQYMQYYEATRDKAVKAVLSGKVNTGAVEQKNAISKEKHSDSSG